MVASRVYQYAKSIALLAVVCLVSSHLDNIPDCPELLTLTTRSITAPAITPDYAPILSSSSLPVEMAASPTFTAAYVVEQPATAVCCSVAGSLEQSADPSPPIV